MDTQNQLVVDNLDKVLTLCEFKPNTYYKFVALIRKKDGNETIKTRERKEAIVKTWLIDNLEYFNQVREDMLSLVKTTGCRIYMTVDRKEVLKTFIQAREYIDSQIDLALFSKEKDLAFSVKALNKMMNSVTSLKESSDRECRRWLFDVDTKDSVIIDKVKFICGEFLREVIETKNGYHIIADKKFHATLDLLSDKDLCNRYDVQSVVEIKDNALVLLAYRED